MCCSKASGLATIQLCTQHISQKAHDADDDWDDDDDYDGDDEYGDDGGDDDDDDDVTSTTVVGWISVRSAQLRSTGTAT